MIFVQYFSWFFDGAIAGGISPDFRQIFGWTDLLEQVDSYLKLSFGGGDRSGYQTGSKDRNIWTKVMRDRFGLDLNRSCFSGL